MNELYGNREKSEKTSKRRWIYLLAAMLVLGVFILLPQGKIVRLSLVVNSGNPVEMTLTLPKDCVLENIYLRSSKNVPRQGKIFDLKVGSREFAVADLEKMPQGDADEDSNYIRTLPDVPWKELFADRSLTVSCHNIDPKIAQYDLELVFEVRGAPETVKKWHNLVKLRHLDTKNTVITVSESQPGSK